jgi:nucleotide-binding universal stress UspA family protein
MTVILCPTRGGRSSIPNQEWAIALAKEQEAHLIFLYVSDVRFLDNLSSPILVDVAHELDEMGEFLLSMAQDRARQAGVEAEILVRNGVFRDALAEVIAERNVDVVVIGSSTQGTGVTTERYLSILAKMVGDRGVEMLVVDAGKLVQRFAATAEPAADEKA